MIPLLPSFLLLARPAADDSERPAWVAAVLREAPAPPALPPSPPVAPISLRHLPPGYYSPAPPPGPSPEDLMRDRVAALLARGDAEAAYRAADAFPWESPRWVNVPLAHARLLTGRGAEAQTALVTSVQLNPPVDAEGRHVTGGIPSDTYLLLSVATSMRGRVYPGQGAYVLDTLRSWLRSNQIADPQVESMDAPTTPEGVLFLSVLTEGRMFAGTFDVPYLEWALRLEPSCVLAGDPLANIYFYQHRGGGNADAARVAAGMVKNLSPGPVRDRFAKRLKEVRARMAAPAIKAP